VSAVAIVFTTVLLAAMEVANRFHTLRVAKPQPSATVAA
jgi:hypothetical protein